MIRLIVGVGLGVSLGLVLYTVAMIAIVMPQFTISEQEYERALEKEMGRMCEMYPNIGDC